MRRLDGLVLKELIGPFLFGVGIFTSLVLASSLLGRFTEYLSGGGGAMAVLKLTLLTLPSIMALSFPMATLLAALLSFGRLSSDSEVIALRAGGASLYRIMAPVAAFGVLVAGLTFWFNEQVVPFSTKQAGILEDDIKESLRKTVGGPVAYSIEQDGKTVLISATRIVLSTQTLQNGQLTWFDKDMNPVASMYAPEMVYKGERNWRVTKGATLITRKGLLNFKGGLWPTGVPNPDASLQDILAAGLRNPSTFSMAELQDRIARLKALPTPDLKQIANLEYMYYNKASVPLAALVFALVGAPLGIRNHRTGAAAGFWLSVLIIFGYMMLGNLMAVYAQGGALAPYLASFTPLAIGLVVAAVTIHRKN